MTSASKKSICEYECSWLECTAHTLNRFTKQMRNKNSFEKKDRNGFKFLLMNTTELFATIEIFKHMCILFLSKGVSNSSNASLDYLKELTERPTDLNEIKSVIRQTNFAKKIKQMNLMMTMNIKMSLKMNLLILSPLKIQ